MEGLWIMPINIINLINTFISWTVTGTHSEVWEIILKMLDHDFQKTELQNDLFQSPENSPEKSQNSLVKYRLKKSQHVALGLICMFTPLVSAKTKLFKAVLSPGWTILHIERGSLAPPRPFPCLHGWFACTPHPRAPRPLPCAPWPSPRVLIACSHPPWVLTLRPPQSWFTAP